MKLAACTIVLVASVFATGGSLAVRIFNESPPESRTIQCMELRYEAQTFNLVCPQFWRREVMEHGLRFHSLTRESHILISFAQQPSGQTNLDLEAPVFAEIGHRPISAAARFAQPTGIGPGTGYDFDWEISGLAMKGRCVIVETNGTIAAFLLLAPRAHFSAGQQVLGGLLGSFQAGSGSPAPW